MDAEVIESQFDETDYVRDEEALRRQEEMDAEADAMLASMPPVRVMRAKLVLAQKGNEDAVSLVAQYVFARFIKRLNKFRVPMDPAYERADLDMVFFTAILQFVPLADGRGDDFYHIGQRGYWAVQSWLRAVGSDSQNRSFHGLERRGPDGEMVDLLEQYIDPDGSDFANDLVNSYERCANQQRYVRVFDTITLNSRERQALDLMRSGALGDPGEKGFRKNLATAMGVSPQRVSQILSGGGPSDAVGLFDKIKVAVAEA